MGQGTDIDEAVGNMEHIIRICEEYKKNIQLLSTITTMCEDYEDAKKFNYRMKEVAFVAIKRVSELLRISDNNIKHTYYPIKKIGAKYIHLKTQKVETLVGCRENFIEMDNKYFMHEDYFNEFYRLVDDEV